MPVLLAAVTDSPLDVDAHTRAVDDARQGACVTFVGTVRNHDPEADGEVVALDYTAHPSAAATLREVAEAVVTQLDPDGETRVAVSHRIGRVAVGESAIVAAVSSPHRALAFTVCGELVDRIKHDVPLWKQQHLRDGSAVWSGLPS
ncbi:molybdenum cofactor biosynthesis protein MoaE [Dermacoccus nishinomiyaensis]|uniref:molybdenum cofactor biosynthesis protein MoaE n=1 Tax=Dermacoccus nishinomiyaensis TaxID=1274 RepID=UPI00248E6C85|nr:molybdenum cofactor biosynthesis protein MoaE [Dermacoccus nishinomiyaensis]